MYRELVFLFTVAFLLLLRRYFRSRRMIQRIDRTLVRPQQPERFDGLSEPLSGMDQLMLGYPVTATLCFETLLSGEKLRDALSVTLNSFPAYSGRVRSGLVEHFSAGVLFEVTIRSEDVRSYTCSRQWQCVDAVLMPMPSNSKHGPLVHARLSLFPASDISVLSVAVDHALADSHSVAHFLQTWSFNCGGDWPACAPSPPQPLGQRRQPQFAPDDRPKSRAELLATYPIPVSCPLDRVAKMLYLPRILWCVARCSAMELRIDAAGVKAWKQRTMALLPEGAWVSSFEVMYAMLFFANAVAGASDGVKVTKVLPIINMRRRVSVPPPEYSGNMWVGQGFTLRLDVSKTMGNNVITEVVADLAKQLHKGLRACLEKGDELTRELKWLNAAQDLGFGDGLKFVAIADCGSGDCISLNSWCQFPWFDVDMGCGERATRFIQSHVGLKHFWNIVPRERESGDMTIHMHLTKRERKVFLDTIADAKMPFYLVESDCG